MAKASEAHHLKVSLHLSSDDSNGPPMPIFTADEARAARHGAHLTVTPCWWVRAHNQDGFTPWEKVPGEAMKQIAPRIVGVEPERLPRHEGFRGVFYISATDSPEHEPGDAAGCELVVADLPPRLPFRVAGTGTGQVATPPPQVAVTLSRSRVPNTEDEILWVVIRNSTRSLAFENYQAVIDRVFAHPRLGQAAAQEKKAFGEALDLPMEPFKFSSVDAYRVLRMATEMFVMVNCGVLRTDELETQVAVEEGRLSHSLIGKFNDLWKEYLVPAGRVDGGQAHILPYLAIIRRKLGGFGPLGPAASRIVDRQAGLLQDKLLHPPLLELIWSYWMEEGMLVQAFNSITRRFQNRANGERDPLAQLELDPLRPLNNVLWGWIQDEQSQLSVLRRAHEYDHQYGFTLQGKALAELRTSDRRSKFLESFHNLLWKCTQFYRQDDDTTVIADGFAILNALKETHYLLAHGAHNQFGDLPSTARQEMLMQQWILSRPELREFLGGRVMVPYPEPWMDRVDAVKTLKGWTDTSVVHFRDLAVFGEQLLLSIRYGGWSTIDDPNSAANWARFWRAEVQGYVHAYRAATSVDLTADITDQRQAQSRFLAPSVHLRNRLLGQASR
jgi:hypothetical protein